MGVMQIHHHCGDRVAERRALFQSGWGPGGVARSPQPLRHWLDTVANPPTHATTKRVVKEAFAEERTVLRSLPLMPYRAVLKLESMAARNSPESSGRNSPTSF
jgi:hypothetical protein